ncbi:MAG: hypothetical protein HOD63_03200 [Bacteroidetes bacterium]|jgi:hypothetical protein|nr:hypothetical protein [Bacteroidota bacterium]MBT5530695.1 hypothetical protein [Cytophagia bacterium]MBT3935847.1 hypothetical protein [Bacteroidota bacterium]MBT4337576.1 hypothetical protein [Bacteroidota bacterium]MBT4970626.1 hypothetical protein [Bacteroidota bacterium]
MKAQFSFTFDHPENPDQPMYWNGKIFARIDTSLNAKHSATNIHIGN